MSKCSLQSLLALFETGNILEMIEVSLTEIQVNCCLVAISLELVV